MNNDKIHEVMSEGEVVNYWELEHYTMGWY